ncbi:uncharacterized protein HD556DRAFT_1313943 [Suillus plorans]|uniref:Uncharacterized protein n=1 Tax=Suillus plorans TaxID=116603 RepID=A0A9P7AD38_9AGAM|nr:uncharacterized protein HD556DRAFT_1313943 [Suillus plorans]KAG1785876.1 hypothetical protein HD556DRAFT_1313943 [Suillus plorans]
MEQCNIAAALPGRRSRRGWHSGQDLSPSDPLRARLVATFAEALGCRLLSALYLLSTSLVGCTGPHHGLGTPVLIYSRGSQVRGRDERGIGGRSYPGRDLVVARAWNVGPVLQALLASTPFAPQCPPGPGWHRHI